MAFRCVLSQALRHEFALKSPAVTSQHMIHLCCGTFRLHRGKRRRGREGLCPEVEILVLQPLCVACSLHVYHSSGLLDASILKLDIFENDTFSKMVHGWIGCIPDEKHYVENLSMRKTNRKSSGNTVFKAHFHIYVALFIFKMYTQFAYSKLK